jgi:two-component system, NtrC family, response regulator AtoC
MSNPKEEKQLASATKQLHQPALQDSVPDSVLFGKTVGMEAVRQKIKHLANTRAPVLIQGESGTGKELLASTIHSRACGSERPFIKITCAGFPASRSGSELFDSENVTSANPQAFNADWIELAQGGTLFFDEISELHPAFQAKLLQLLQAEGVEEIQVICSTIQDLEAEIEAERFRRDLLYRINVFILDLLPLRQRTEDIPEMTAYMLRNYALKYNLSPRMISPQLMELMQRYNWPGNIRELENLVRRYVILGSEQVIGSELLAKVSTDFHSEEPSESISLKKLSRQAAFELERRVILKALNNHGWNRKQAARSLNISYRALLYKIKQAGLPPKRSGAAREAVPVSSEE